MKRYLVCALLLGTAPLPAEAQRTLRSIGDDFRNAGSDIIHIWTAPFHATKADWAGAAIAAGATLLTLPIDDDVDGFVVNNPNSVLVRGNVFRENRRFNLGDLGTGKRMQPLAGIVYVVGFAADSRSLRDAALGCSAVQASNSVLRKGILYNVIARPRPAHAASSGADQYDVALGNRDWNYRSFPAGHFMNAIGCASYLNNRFQMGVAEPLIYAVAAGIGAARIADRRHWTSDTVLSLAMGYAIGKAVAGQQLRRLQPDLAGSAATASMSTSGAYTMSWNLAF